MRQDYDKLRHLAEAATPGPWRQGLGEDRPHLDYPSYDILTVATRESNHGLGTVTQARIVLDGEWENPADTAFVAAFDPTTALALLDRIEQLQAACREAGKLSNTLGEWFLAGGPEDALQQLIIDLVPRVQALEKLVSGS